MKTNPELDVRLAAFEIDHGKPELSFARRLARENAWRPDFAERVLREYFRFVYLACVSDSAVTPSVAVDQAWHLHLCYTRSYWTELCQNVLCRPLHHGPTQGGVVEDSRYRAQYEHTLRLYEREFDEPPPRDIWPAAELRFAQASNPFWVSSDRFFVIEKSCFRKVAASLGLISLGIFCSGAYASGSASLLVIVILVCAAVILIWWFSTRGKGGPGSCGSGCGSCGSAGSSDSGCGGGGCGGGGCGGD